MPNPAVIKAAVALLSDERTRKGIGWIIAAILSPAILLVALLCSMASGSSAHNTAVIELCFNGGAIPENMPAEYAACIRDMQDSFALLDGSIEEINAMTEEGNSLDGIRVKAIFSLCTSARTGPSQRITRYLWTASLPMRNEHAPSR